MAAMASVIEPNKITGEVIEFVYPDSGKAYATTGVEGVKEFEERAEPAEAAPETKPEHTPGMPTLEQLVQMEAEFNRRMTEETRQAFEAGREQGRKQEHEQQAQALQQADEQRKRQSAELILRFQQERERYLHQVEQEVVRLALAVAARILRREAQMDPLLLTGAVRVALGQLSGSTQMALHVPPADIPLWQEAIALLPNLALKPQLIGKEGMRLGDCMIETEMGSVDLGIRAQLAEIERGFFDRAGAGRKETETQGGGAHPAEVGR